MFQLSEEQVGLVHGGYLLQAYSDTAIKSSSEVQNLYSNLGYAGTSASVNCSATTNVTTQTVNTSTSGSPSCTFTSTFPFLDCTLGIPQTTSSNTATTTRSITCIEN